MVMDCPDLFPFLEHLPAGNYLIPRPDWFGQKMVTFGCY